MFVLRSMFLAYRVFFFSFTILLFIAKILMMKIFGIKSRKTQNNKIATFYNNVNKSSMFKDNGKQADCLEKNKDNFIANLGNSAIFSQINNEKLLFNPRFVSEGKNIQLECNSFEEKNTPLIIKMPNIDFMFISQSHLNYLSQLSHEDVNHINNRVENIVCPIGMGKYLKILGFDSVKEINFEQKTKLNKYLEANVSYSKKTKLDDFILENERYKIFYKKNDIPLINIIEKYDKINDKKNQKINEIQLFNNSKKNIYSINNIINGRLNLKNKIIESTNRNNKNSLDRTYSENKKYYRNNNTHLNSRKCAFC